MSEVTRTHGPHALDVMLYLALPQGLVESFAQRQIGLVLGAGQELFNLPGTRSGRGLRFRTGSGRRSVLLNRGGRLWGCFLRIRSAEHSGHGMSNGVTNGGTDGNSTGRGSHLGHQTRTLARGSHRGSNGAWWGMLDGRLGWWWSGTWSRSSRHRRRSALGWRWRSGPSSTWHFPAIGLFTSFC